MKTLWLILMGVFAMGGTIAAQEWQKVDPQQEFNRRLTETAGKIQSIECDFIQGKYLDVFAEKVISKGKFYFRKASKVCLAYTEPIDYLMVVNEDKLKIVSGGKTTVADLGANQSMEGMNTLLAACMTGDLSLLGQGYRMEYFQRPDAYLVRIIPLNQGVKAYLSEMAVYFDKKDMAVSKLRLSENAADYTEYEFINRKFNTLTDDSKFMVH